MRQRHERQPATVADGERVHLGGNDRRAARHGCRHDDSTTRSDFP
ncbi:MAG: hypothetical protein WKF58_16500 [Ilumatobacteraceae bacterium]